MTALQGIKSKPSRTKKGFSKKHTLTTCIPNVQVSIWAPVPECYFVKALLSISLHNLLSYAQTDNLINFSLCLFMSLHSLLNRPEGVVETFWPVGWI